MIRNEELLLVLKSTCIGDCDNDLGKKLMSAFLKTLLDSEVIPARIICLNSAIFLTTEGTPVNDQMKSFEDAGTEILSCISCLEFFEKQDKLIVGQATTMKDTIDSLMSFEKVLSP